jgi:hypothetical protein
MFIDELIFCFTLILVLLPFVWPSSRLPYLKFI